MREKKLAMFVSRTLKEKNLSTYDVERRANKRISQSTVNRIANGEVRSPGPETLSALAVGLGVPEHEVFSAVRKSTKGELSHERLASIEFTYDDLSKGKKAKADYVIEICEREIERLKSEE